ncbi:MAG: hypothetical protein LBG89_00585 [Rickettsiales bacterium]|jgi:hypothetical protein|nr:hypothetical protein [Rickettsiales bacterium]
MTIRKLCIAPIFALMVFGAADRAFGMPAFVNEDIRQKFEETCQEKGGTLERAESPNWRGQFEDECKIIAEDGIITPDLSVKEKFERRDAYHAFKKTIETEFKEVMQDSFDNVKTGLLDSDVKPNEYKLSATTPVGGWDDGIIKVSLINGYEE